MSTRAMSSSFRLAAATPSGPRCRRRRNALRAQVLQRRENRVHEQSVGVDES